MEFKAFYCGKCGKKHKRITDVINCCNERAKKMKDKKMKDKKMEKEIFWILNMKKDLLTLTNRKLSVLDIKNKINAKYNINLTEKDIKKEINNIKRAK